MQITKSGKRVTGIKLIDVAINLFALTSLLKFTANPQDYGSNAILAILPSIFTQVFLIAGITMVLIGLAKRDQTLYRQWASLTMPSRLVVIIDAVILTALMSFNYGFLFANYAYGAPFGTYIDKATVYVGIGVLWGVFRLTYRLSRWALLQRAAVHSH